MARRGSSSSSSGRDAPLGRAAGSSPTGTASRAPPSNSTSGATRRCGTLGAVFESEADLATIEEAVVAFAQARAGSDHTAAEVAADVVALVRLAWPGAGHGGTSGMGGSMPSACSPVPSAPGRRSGWRSRRPSTASILARTHSAEVAVARLPFGTAAARTFAALVGTPVADQRA